MEPDIIAKLEAIATQEKAIFESVEKTRKYMFWSFMLQLALIVLPLFALMFAIPLALSNLSGLYDGLL